ASRNEATLRRGLRSIRSWFNPRRRRQRSAGRVGGLERADLVIEALGDLLEILLEALCLTVVLRALEKRFGFALELIDLLLDRKHVVLRSGFAIGDRRRRLGGDALGEDRGR